LVQAFIIIYTVEYDNEGHGSMVGAVTARRVRPLVWFSCPVSCPLCRLLRRPADVRRVRTLRERGGEKDS
jgi:hypothetical protein